MDEHGYLSQGSDACSALACYESSQRLRALPYLRPRSPDCRGPVPTISFAASSAVGSGLFLFAVISPSVAGIMAPFPVRPCRASVIGPETPLIPESAKRREIAGCLI